MRRFNVSCILIGAMLFSACQKEAETAPLPIKLNKTDNAAYYLDSTGVDGPKSLLVDKHWYVQGEELYLQKLIYSYSLSFAELPSKLSSFTFNSDGVLVLENDDDIVNINYPPYDVDDVDYPKTFTTSWKWNNDSTSIIVPSFSIKMSHFPQEDSIKSSSNIVYRVALIDSTKLILYGKGTYYSYFDPEKYTLEHNIFMYRHSTNIKK
ncbi:MAG TPA: hypothetical protein VK202_09130 [Bacteroidia bacterium]|nr:hypothetical protein [Bacteroidia bacterium]